VPTTIPHTPTIIALTANNLLKIGNVRESEIWVLFYFILFVFAFRRSFERKTGAVV
jgi:hypothetical protein